jgi:hypothetical protein
MLTSDSFKKWLDTYRVASEECDPKVAAELFTQDAKYYETPFDNPIIGRDAIYRYWSEASQAMKDTQFSYKILAVKENLGIALWQAKYVSLKTGENIVLDGTLLAEFDEHDSCNSFREWWHRQVTEPTPHENT